mgnify:CR=1 FL=1
MNLLILIALPLLTALGILLVKPMQSRTVSLAGAAVQMLTALYLFVQYRNAKAAGLPGDWAFEAKYDWFPSWRIGLHLGVDGISVAMILLTAFVVIAGVLVSWNVKKMSREFHFLLILLSLGAYGFFISLDLFTMFFFLELAVIPKYLLIGIWGSGHKEYSANKLALMLMAGSALVLIGMLAIYHVQPAGSGSFDLTTIAASSIPESAQKLIFPLLFVGFGIFTALFPFHTWVPDGHSSAPTAGSMFLAGISMTCDG